MFLDLLSFPNACTNILAYGESEIPYILLKYIGVAMGWDPLQYNWVKGLSVEQGHFIRLPLGNKRMSGGREINRAKCMGYL